MQLKPILAVIIKFSGIAISVLYILYATVVIKQIGSMKKVLLTDGKGILDFVAYIQFGIATLLLVFSLLFL